jgi:ectoine hydroxylase-related dioxygenase (phytanoyl-CoA dioxygenase family)
MRFNPQQIEFYRTKGYLAGPRVLSDGQLDTLRRRIEDILTGRIPFPEHLLGDAATKTRLPGQLPAVKIVNLFRHDKVFAEVMHNPLIASLAGDLMPGPVRVWEDQMVYKPPGDDKAALAWHQDYTYWDQVGPPELGTCWIALDDATVENGCMHVIPGSHRWRLGYKREDVDGRDPDWLLRRPDMPGDADLTPVPCIVKAGHCHFHHCLTFHGSFGNRTRNPRRSYVLHLMPGNTRRIGSSWNPRQGRVEDVAVGEIVRGPSYPELAGSAKE